MLHISLDVLKRVSKARLTSSLPTLVSARKQENGRMMFSHPTHAKPVYQPNPIDGHDVVPPKPLAELAARAFVVAHVPR